MAYPGRTGNGLFFEQALKLRNAAHALANGDAAVLVHGDTSAVVSPIFEPVQSLEQYIGCIPLSPADIPDNSAHGWSAPNLERARSPPKNTAQWTQKNSSHFDRRVERCRRSENLSPPRAPGRLENYQRK
jgi:hypothetical protein